MKNLIFILIVTLSISCSEAIPQETKMVNDDFITGFINSLEYKSIISNNKHSVSYKFKKNPQYENKTDSVINVKINDDIITYYKAFGNIILTDAKIKTQDLKFDNKRIYVGIQKKYFQTRFNNKALGSKLIISDTEERILCTFLFKNDILTEINFQALIE